MSFKLNKQFPTFLPAREECDCCISLSMLSFIHPSTMAKQTAYRILLVKRNSLLPIILYQWILTSFKCYSWVSLETDMLFKGDCANGHFHCFRKKERKKRAGWLMRLGILYGIAYALFSFICNRFKMYNDNENVYGYFVFLMNWNKWATHMSFSFSFLYCISFIYIGYTHGWCRINKNVFTITVDNFACLQFVLLWT